MTSDFVNELPVADVHIGPRSHLRLYGFSDIEPRLVEIRMRFHGSDGVLNLTVEQAETLAAGLLKAVAKARHG